MQEEGAYKMRFNDIDEDKNIYQLIAECVIFILTLITCVIGMFLL